ncbi:hypothetical protein RclHR1_10530006 [Rhizophagus clarus]|uniref:Protein kinase domain-containing protein n=1 Tax=Rhizophagus clarus TaxID=94130 RepID=A0A2Z6Q1U4_9GLOM|nr:hypothetical protein RclHR1_10530006 [Rhizophagus clarus]
MRADNIASDFKSEITILHGICGITQDPETKTYMVILDNRCGRCNAIYFQQYFNNWTSGNNYIDKFIQDSQLSDHYFISKALEWIPFERFYDVKYIAKGGFGKVYRAKWVDGYIVKWDQYNRIWERNGQHKFVALKSLNNSKNINSEFINEAMLHYKIVDSDKIIRFYGITQEPVTKNYVMVLDYAQYGSLRNYLNINYNELSWNYKISYLKSLASGLEHIHKNELIHRDLHPGNLLVSNYAKIADMGLCKPANYDASENTKNDIYGVLPYIAPEVLRGQNYTKASDIYSFGIIMYELFSGLPPYHDVGHDINLAMKICQGLRPRFTIKVPQLIVQLIKRCLDSNPLNRPTAEEIDSILHQWNRILIHQDFNAELYKQIKEADDFNNLSTSITPSTSLELSYETHSGAIYISRLLNYNNLPEPKNSHDYYEQNDNIISMKFSESLQIDVSKSKINDDNIPEQEIVVKYHEKNDNISMGLSESLQIDISQLKIADSNSNDYYDKQNDKLISIKSSASLSLQIDVSQLNVNGDDQK